MDLKDIKELIDIVGQSDITEFSYKQDNEKIVIKRGEQEQLLVNSPQYAAQQYAAVPVSAPLPSAGNVQEHSPSTPSQDSHAKKHVITAPLVGTLYRSPSPDAPPYVNVGDKIAKGQVLCLIEAMKLMNEIEADIDGKVIAILVENANPVEYGADIFVIEPA